MLKGFNTELDALFAKYTIMSQDEINGSTEKNISPATCEKVRENAQKVFENEMSITLRQGMSQVLNEFVVTPYQTLLEDYIDKTNMEADLCNDRIERAIA